MRILYLTLSILSATIMATFQHPAADISNGTIKAKLYLPDDINGYYRGVRFDRSGNIYSLEYAGHSYFGQWFKEYDPFTHDAIMGPVEDFQPVEFNSRQPGETFLKIGVGMLVKPDTKVYTIRKLYENKNPGRWSVEKHGNRILFRHDLLDTGYSYKYEKEVILPEGKAELLLLHRLKNTGMNSIHTTVYDHNFFMIDNQPAGPGIEISFPFEVGGEGLGIGQGRYAEIGGRSIRFLKDVDPDSVVYCSDLKGYGSSSSDYDIRINNNVSRAGVRITCNRPVVRMPFWSCPTTACPEPYIAIDVEPGEEFTWEIRYEFYTW